MHWNTTTQLLDALQDRDESLAWDHLCDHFAPVIEHFCLHLGLSYDQAQDATQETLMAFLKAFRAGKYDRSQGRLSAWLFGIARNTIRHQQSKPAAKPTSNQAMDACRGSLADDHLMKQTWETQWQHILLTRCLARVQQETDPAVYEAFRLYALEEQNPEHVARHLAISRNAVYIAKSRVLSRLRELIHQLDDPEVQ